MKFTKEMFEKALLTSHKMCEKECIFEETAKESSDILLAQLEVIVDHELQNISASTAMCMAVVSEKISGMMQLAFQSGWHTGYRLKEIELETKKEISDLEKTVR